MIKPKHNYEALHVLHESYFFPLRRLMRRSLLARECNALIQADRYLAQADKGKT